MRKDQEEAPTSDASAEVALPETAASVGSGDTDNGASPPPAQSPSATVRTSVWRPALTAALLPCVLLAALYLDIRRGEEQTRGAFQNLERRLGDAMESTHSAQETSERLRVAMHERQALHTQIEELRQFHQELQVSLSQLEAYDARDPLHWRLAELEHLFSTATRQVSLLDAPRDAIKTLEIAAARLEEMDYPDLNGVRKQLAKDLVRLHAVETLDLADLALQLSVLGRRVRDLPLRGAAGVDPGARERPRLPETGGVTSEEAGINTLFAALAAGLRGQFKLQRIPKVTDGVVLPEHQEAHAHALLRLYLESARFAALRRDQANFDASMADVATTLQSHFDSQSPLVRGISKQLRELARSELRPELPLPVATLEALRVYHVQAFQREPLKAPGAH